MRLYPPSVKSLKSAADEGNRRGFEGLEPLTAGDPRLKEIAMAKKKAKRKPAPAPKSKPKAKSKVKAQPKKKAKKSKPKARPAAKKKAKPKSKVTKRPAARFSAGGQSKAKRRAPVKKLRPAGVTSFKGEVTSPAPPPAYVSVDEYIRSLPGWQAEVARAIREIIRTAAPNSAESMKWGQPVYEEDGPICYFKSFSDHVTFGFWRGTEMPDPAGLLRGEGDKMRHVRLTMFDDVPREALEEFVRHAVRLNRERGNPTFGR